MDAIPYVDSLVKEYLLFRGFTGSLRIFNRDVSTDRGRGFQADQLCELVFRKLLPQSQANELMEVLDFLSKRVYSRLPGSHEPMIRKLEVSILRAHLVLAIQAGKLEVVKDFFTQHAELLLQQAEASDWLVWFALPYISNPAQDERFKGIQHLPLPGLLHFNTDRLERQALRKQVDELQHENNQLKQQMTSSQTTQPAASHNSMPRNTQSQQSQQASGLKQHSQSQLSGSSKSQPAQHKSPKPVRAAVSGPKPISTSKRSQEASPAATAHSIQSEAADSQQANSGALPSEHSAVASEPQAALSQALDNGPLSRQPHQGSSNSWPATMAVNGIDNGQQSNLQYASTSRSCLGSATSNGLADDSATGLTDSKAPPSRHASKHSVLSGEASPDDSPTGSSQSGIQKTPRPDSAVTGNGDNTDLDQLVTSQEQLMGHDQGVTCCSFSPNGQNLATASSDGVVRIWAPESIQSNASRAAVLLCGAPVSALAWDNRADKVMLVGTRGKGIKAWHLDTKSMISHIQPDSSCPHVLDVACSPTDPSFVSAATAATGSTIAVPDSDSGGTLTMWNMRAFRKLRSFDLPERSAAGSVSFAPDGQTLAAGVSDGSVQIYDVHNSKAGSVASWHLPGQHSKAASVRHCADEAAVVSLTQSGLLQQWDLRRLSSRKLGQLQPQWSVDLSRFCRQDTSQQSFSIACSSKAVAMNTFASALPVVVFDSAASEPHIQPLTVLAQGIATSDVSVSAVAWHPSASVLCCGLSQSLVCLEHLKLN